jgi:hypothetical protein
MHTNHEAAFVILLIAITLLLRLVFPTNSSIRSK